MAKGAGTDLARPALTLAGAEAADAWGSSRKPEYSVHATTDKGLALRLDFYRRIDDGINEGWVVDLVEAHAPDGPAGYLKLSYIPTDELQRVFPDAFTWAIRRKGEYGGLELLLDELPEAQWQREQLVKALRSAEGWLPPDEERKRKAALEAASVEQLRKWWANRKAQIAAKHAQEYERFCEFHHNRPLVDYISVYSEGEHILYSGGQRIPYTQAPRCEHDRRRQGVGSLLYQAGAAWLHSRGMELHASGVQSDEANAVWRQLGKQGLVKKLPFEDRERLVLDVSKITHPQLRRAFPSPATTA